MLRIVPTVSRFTSTGLLGKVASSTHTPHTSRRTFASTSASGVDITLMVDEKGVTISQGSSLIQLTQASEATGATNSSDRLDEAESAYWLARGHEMMKLTRGLGSPHFFNLPGRRWAYLYKHIPQLRERTKDKSLHFFFKGSIHEGVRRRGYLWPKDGPNLNEINWELFKDKDTTIPEDQEQKIRRFVDYWNPILTASIPFSRQDVGDHPCCKPRETLNTLKSTKEESESRETPTEEDDKELANPDAEDALSQLISSGAREDTIGEWPMDDGLGQFNLESLIKEGLDSKASHSRWEHINQMSIWLQLKREETFYRQADLPNVNIDTLTQEQREVLDVFTGTYTKILAGESPPQLLLNIDGTAGCGKTYLIRAICQELRRMARENDQRDPIRVVAPSGVAAMNISGRTVQFAFSLAFESTKFRLLSGRHLTKCQQLWEGVHFVIFDEKSMIGARVLAEVDWRTRQLLPRPSLPEADKPFSNLNITLVGDFAQLPPIHDSPLYTPPSKTASYSVRHGSALYSLFKKSYCLQTVHRHSDDSPEQVQFRDLLRHVSEGNLSEDERRTLITRTDNRLSPAVKAQFNDTMYLLTTSEVKYANLRHLAALNQPFAPIMARHDGNFKFAAAMAEAGKAGRLEPYVVLAKGAKVMLTRNIWQELGLVNATTGVVEDIIWASDSPRYELPIAALVSFPSYTGPTLWYTEPREGFPKGIPILPIVPLKVTFKINGQIMSRTQLPLRLAWATTLNKAQGLTLSKIKLGLGGKEISTRVIYFALSRVKTLDSIMFVDHNDLAQVKNLEGSRLRGRLEDFARRYPAPVNQ